MRDPFWPPPQALVDYTKFAFYRVGFATLPLHIHEVFIAYAGYQSIYSIAAPILSKRFAPKTYNSLPAQRKVNWNAKVTSMIQSTLITSLALYVIASDKERKSMDWTGRIWGYTGAMGMVQALAGGYFIWDLLISLVRFDVLGIESLAHAVSALLVTSIGFRPFANYYGLNFILYELSTPFLNIHWFLDKLNMTGSRMQLYNGIALMTTFFCSRVLWGNYQSMRIYKDVWTAMTTPSIELPTANSSIFAYMSQGGPSISNHPGAPKLPTWLVILYLGSNTMLNFLNIYWFWLMVKAMRKRFQSPKDVKKE